MIIIFRDAYFQIQKVGILWLSVRIKNGAHSHTHQSNKFENVFFFQCPRTGAVKCIRSMGKQNPIDLKIYSSAFCLVSVLSLTSLVSSQLSYHVDSLVDTRNAMLTYSYEHEGRPYLQCVLRKSFKFVASLTAS